MENNAGSGVSKNVTLVITSVASFIGSFMMSSVSVALPTIGSEFAMEAVLLGWVVTSMTLPTAALFLAAGRLADIFGRRRMFLYGIIIITAASFLCAFASSAGMLITGRVLQGIGAAMTHGNAVAILTSVFPGSERGKVLGISLAFTYAGASMGPFLGGVFTQHLGWRSIFLLVGLLDLIVIWLVLWKMKGEWAEARNEKFDFGGSAIFAVSLGLLMYGLTVLLTPAGVTMLVLGLLGLAGFVWWETKIASPILNVSLFRKNIVFVFSNLATLANYTAAMAVIFLLNLYLQYIRGFSPQVAGTIMLVQTVIMTITAPVAGRLSDRINPQVIAAIGLGLNGLTFLLFLTFDSQTGLALLIISMVAFGFGWGLFSSPNTNAVMGSIENRFLGVASATIGTMRSMGMMLSVGIVMVIFSVYIGAAEITPEYYPAFLTSARAGYILFAIICFAGVFSQLAGWKTRTALT